MAEEKVTTMVLSADLQCSKCFKLVKKLLCKFPEIRDQKYDVKANKVTITVVGDSPEKIRDKLLCMGCGCIKSIEIIKPTPPKPPAPPKPPSPPEDKPMKVSVDLNVQGFCCCKFCSGRPWDPCSCGGQGQCDQCNCKWWSGKPWGPCFCGGQGQCVLCCGKWCSGKPWGPCSCGGQGQCDLCCGKWCSGKPWGPCSCGGQGQCNLCCGRPICDNWPQRGSGREQTQQGCSIM